MTCVLNYVSVKEKPNVIDRCCGYPAVTAKSLYSFYCCDTAVSSSGDLLSRQITCLLLPLETVTHKRGEHPHNGGGEIMNVRIPFFFFSRLIGTVPINLQIDPFKEIVLLSCNFPET